MSRPDFKQKAFVVTLFLAGVISLFWLVDWQAVSSTTHVLFAITLACFGASLLIAVYSAQKQATQSALALSDLQSALRQSEERLSRIIDAAPNAIFITDRAGRYLMANRQMERAVNMAAGTIIGQTNDDIFTPEVQRILSAGEELILETGEPLDTEIVLGLGAAQKRYLMLRFPLHDADNQVTGFCGMLTDITERARAEQELQAQYYLLQSIINAIPAPIFYKDANSIYLGCNRAFEAFIGQERSEIIGKSVYDIAAPDLALRYKQADEELLDSGTSQTYEALVRYSDGAMHDVMFHKAVFEKSAGEVGGLVGVMLDITEQARAIRESQTLREAINDMGQAFAVFDARDRLFLCNKNYSGLHRDIAHTVFPGSDFTNHCRAIAEAGICVGARHDPEAWLKSRIAHHKKPLAPFEFEHANGSVFLIFESRLSDGGTITLMTDITERRQAETAREASEARLSEAQRLAQLGHWTWSLSTGEVFWSDEIFRILGLDADKVRPGIMPLARALDANDRPWVHRALRRCAQSGKEIVLDIEVIWPTGMRRQVHAIGEAVIDPGGTITGLRGTLHDISELRQAEQALKQSEERHRAFAADAAHELRTPLAIMKLNLEAMDNSEAVLGLQKDVDAMQRLVDQMMVLTRLDSLAIGKSDRVDLRKAAIEIAAFLAPIAVKESRLIEVVGTEKPVIIRGDAGSLHQAFRNLIENAIRYSARNSTITISVTDDGVFSVADQGRGVPEDQRTMIFKRFMRADRRGGGSGLGLSIVQRTAEAHGATVRVGDAPGGGALFTLTFPVIGMSGPERRTSERRQA